MRRRRACSCSFVAEYPCLFAVAVVAIGVLCRLGIYAEDSNTHGGYASVLGNTPPPYSSERHAPMHSTPARIALFAGLLALVFAGAALAGSALDPDVGRSAAHGTDREP